jgi:hypothetical protein
MGKQEGKRSLGRLKRRWVDNIKIDLRERGREGMVWYGMVWIGWIWIRIGTIGGHL